MLKFFLTAGVSLLTVCSVAFPADKTADKTLESLSPDTVIANVDGAKITVAELEQRRADNLYQPKNTYYQAERAVLLDFIDEMLVKRQAEKEGVTVEQLMERHIMSKLPKDPSDEAMRVYYEGVDTKEPYEAMRGRILESIRQGRIQKLRASYLQSLRDQANIVVNLPAPRVDIDMAGTPLLGEKNAPVMFIEFADYQCPYCQQVAPDLLKLQSEYKGKVAFAFKDMPLPMHEHAEKAAEASHCAAVQGKYWDYHDTLFATQKLEVADLKQTARKLNLDGAAFDKCLDSGEQAQTVKAQLNQGNKLGLQGTPAFFINGRLLSGAQSYDQLRKAIDQELALAPAPKGTTTTASR